MDAVALKPTPKAYAELQQAYDFFNDELFAGELPACLITFQRERRSYGYFSNERFFDPTSGEVTDEIAMNCRYFATVPLVEILQTLVHEMVHLWQFRCGTPSRKGYHNREFADKMKAVGLMPSSTGQPGGKEVGQHMADYPLPGGPFIVACEKLLQTAFRITWMDRFPIHPEHVSTPEELAGDPSAEALVALGAFDVPAESDSLDGESPAIAGEVSTNNSNRMKYTCPVCGDNIWGKWGKNRIQAGCFQTDECKGARFEPQQ
ncbi:SprT-like domain-containing protein [Burkholderia cenocepacia]|uniref:SprT-like domain-containing protein n=1 Tax=Burkholderia cenocepacia TaxID=95486 RepID=UPI00264C245B|nr:SprT-like domain-containing protein [Burkholderia cenocepacia]MDN7664090.1 SprT-like domain-containing protein [Burkholderia cenocepacia]